MTISWDELLEKLICENSFKSQISKNGYYLSESSYQPLIKKYNFTHSQNAAGFLSIDFFSKQSKTLRDNNLYIIRIGKGQFVIFEIGRAHV